MLKYENFPKYSGAEPTKKTNCPYSNLKWGRKPKSLMSRIGNLNNMANATATQSNGVCFITTPATLSSMILIPKTSGKAAWINYCTWSDDSQPTSQLLGEWSAQMTNISIVSNPDSLINTTTNHGTITTSTDPTVTGMTQSSLTFTHQDSSSGPIVADDLNITVINVTDDITIITIFAEDSGDQNYLDFNMTLIITDN